MHGLGDTANGWLPIFRDSKLLTNTKIVLLTANKIPVEINYN